MRRRGSTCSRILPSLACASVVATLAAPARADAPDPLLPASKLSPWDQGSPRMFVAARGDLGIVFARPALMIGYGRPHWEWFGADAYALTTNSFGAVYGGLRASLPFLDFTMGVRDTFSYRRSFVPIQARYVAADVDQATTSRARYLSLDNELTGVIPVPGGYALWGFVATTSLDVPRDKMVYDESLRVVMRPPFAINFRLGYLLKLGTNDFVKVGVLNETVVMPSRDGPVERLGPMGSIAMTDHTEIVGVFTVVVRSPDTLGIFHSPYGFLGLRYRWATGEENPAFP